MQKVRQAARDVLDAFIKTFERHSYSARLDAHHAVRNTFMGRNNVTSCAQTDLLVFSGRDNVDGAGRVTLPIQSLLCGAATEGLEDFAFTELVIVQEPNFVATPRGSTPTFLTAVTHSTPQQLPNEQGTALIDRSGNFISARTFLGDVSVEVMAWRNDGSPAGDTGFSWVCTVEAMRRITLDG